MPMSELIVGTVKWFDQTKGYGFIEVNGQDVLVHHSEIQIEGFRHLKEGEKVQLILIQSPNGLRAKNVKKLV